jgi:cytochrome oxidase Cu insertion factor (SCO1/SenC/PrrC family)
MRGFGFIKVLLAAGIVLAMVFIVSCSNDDDDDFEMLNGVWSRGDIVVTFNNSSGVFTQINSNSGWKTLLDNRTIKIGDKKFRNIEKTDNLKWTCQSLTYYPSNYSTDWENCTITMNANGQTLQTYTPNTSNPFSTYTKE